MYHREIQVSVTADFMAKDAVKSRLTKIHFSTFLRTTVFLVTDWFNLCKKTVAIAIDLSYHACFAIFYGYSVFRDEAQ